MKSRSFILFFTIELLGLIVSVSPASGKEVSPVQALTFSPDSKILASGVREEHGRTSVKLWDVVSQQLLATLQVPNDVFSLAFSPDGMLLAVGSTNCTLWHVASKRPIATLNGYTRAVTFSPDGKRLARTVGSPALAVQLWDLQSQQEVALLSTGEGLWRHLSGNIAFSPDGKLLAGGSGASGRILIWDIENPQAPQILVPAGFVVSVAFSPDGKLLASGGLMPATHSVILWDVETRTEVEKLEAHANGVDSVVFSPDGRILISAGENLAILWDVKRKKQIGSLFGNIDLPIAVSPDGRWLANTAGGERALFDDQIRLWQLPEPLGVTPHGQKLTPWGFVKQSLLPIK